MSGAARMAGWAGFSEDELRRMRSRRELPDPKDPGACPPEAFLSRQQPQRKKVPVQKLAKQDKVPVAQDHSSSIKQNNTTENLPGSTQVTKPLEETPKQPVVDNKETTSESPSMRAKEDEELSKKDVELSKRTQAEAVKLNKIQKQLQALDEMVSTDIGILRNRIEQACIEFSQAKKRYDKAESEYVSAKLDFYKKTQIKEQLTEHLCTIIQQNELRKAKKLEELMQQLEVEADEERLDLEIEVEQILQLQEAEAKKQLVPSASDKSQLVLNPDSIESPSEKESSAESHSGQSKIKPTSDLDDTSKCNQRETCPSSQGDDIIS
ncbi:RAB6-interacting golgin isoform X2 [Ranitomeya imitator]|uniref:RAB6-interacting golgin isoform X2 n=1 Tax=Ranitomeya imitator TaxID=111125 RepID=UPI0037E92354